MNAAEGSLMANSFQRESSTSSSGPGTQPATPELGLRRTPDTTPESLRTALRDRKQVSLRLGDRRDIDLVTPSISSKAPSTQDIADNIDHSSQHSVHSEASEGIIDNRDRYLYYPIESDLSPVQSELSPVQSELGEGITGTCNHCSHYSIQNECSEELSKRLTQPPTPASYPQYEESHSSFSIVKSTYHSVLGLLNLAKQRKSRADNARVRSMIDLLNSTPTIKRTGVRNITRKLTPKQYEQLLRVVEDPNDNSVLAEVKDSLPFEYLRSKNRFEIRMTTPMHAGIQGLVGGSIGAWHVNLMESNDPRISDISETILSLSNERLTFSERSGAKDTKAPDWGIRHVCNRSAGRECRYPNLVFEVGWTQTKKELKEKTELYINRSNGEIRTIVAIHMHEMFLAERKNEARLKRMYRKAEVDESYCYWEDENNQTGSASILVWRAKKRKDGTVQIGNPQEKIFRDIQGNTIQSGSFCIPFYDFICTDIIDAQEGKLKAPSLEISWNALCKTIQRTLKVHRKQRASEIREDVEREEQEKIEKKKKEEERLQKATEGRRASDRAPKDESFFGPPPV